MKCVKCGAEFEDNRSALCENCRNAVNSKGKQLRKPKKIKNKTKIWLIVVAVLLVLVMIPLVWLLSLMGKIERGNLSSDLGISESPELPFDEDVKNIALYGLDTRSNDNNGRSDAIIVLSIDKKHNAIKLCSIARDTYIEFENGNHNKLTHAWAFGKATLAVKTLNRNFNLDITDYVTVNFYQFAAIIDYIGGVTIDVNDHEMMIMNTKYIPYIQKMGIECELIKEPGVQHLNGGQALAYARDRYTGSDMDRGNRQREVLSAMFDEAKKLNPLKYPKLIEMVLSECTTTLSNSEMLSIGMWTLANNPKLMSKGLPDKETCPFNTQMINGASYVVYDLQTASGVLHDYIYNASPEEKQETTSLVPSQSK